MVEEEGEMEDGKEAEEKEEKGGEGGVGGDAWHFAREVLSPALAAAAFSSLVDVQQRAVRFAYLLNAVGWWR